MHKNEAHNYDDSWADGAKRMTGAYGVDKGFGPVLSSWEGDSSMGNSAVRPKHRSNTEPKHKRGRRGRPDTSAQSGHSSELGADLFGDQSTRAIDPGS